MSGTAAPPSQRFRVVLLSVAVVVAMSALWGAMESHYRSCVTAAEARYPAVSVSAVTGKQTGPLKLSFVVERQRAIEGCSRLPI